MDSITEMTNIPVSNTFDYQSGTEHSLEPSLLEPQEKQDSALAEQRAAMRQDTKDEISATCQNDLWDQDDLDFIANLTQDSISEVSTDSVSTLVHTTAFNAKIYLDFSPEKTHGGVTIRFTALRPPTILGDTQGDHVISHRLALTFFANTIQAKPLKEVCGLLQQAFNKLIPDPERLVSKASYPSNVPKFNGYRKFDPNLREPLEKGETKEYVDAEIIQHYRQSVRTQYAKAVLAYISALLSWYNALKGVTYPKGSGMSLKNNESAAIKALEFMCELIPLRQSVNNSDNSIKKIQLTKKALALNGSFVDGMHLLFECESIEAVRKHFTLSPNIKDSDLRFTEGLCNTFLTESFDKIASGELSGRIMAHCFDYRLSIGRSLEELEIMLTRCHEMVLLTFAELHALPWQTSVRSFKCTVVERQGWGRTVQVNAEAKIEAISEETLASHQEPDASASMLGKRKI